MKQKNIVFALVVIILVCCCASLLLVDENTYYLPTGSGQFSLHTRFFQLSDDGFLVLKLGSNYHLVGCVVPEWCRIADEYERTK